MLCHTCSCCEGALWLLIGCIFIYTMYHTMRYLPAVIPFFYLGCMRELITLQKKLKKSAKIASNKSIKSKASCAQINRVARLPVYNVETPVYSLAPPIPFMGTHATNLRDLNKTP